MRRWEVDGTGSGSCPMASFGINGVEPSGSTTKCHFIGKHSDCRARSIFSYVHPQVTADTGVHKFLLKRM
jgi:hypothetical protein